MPTQTDLGRALATAREQTDELFRIVRPAALYDRPLPERHRIVFYIGHVEAFDWNLIARYALDKRSFHPTFDQLFAFGIDPPPGQLPCDQPSDWPSLDEAGRYCARVRQEIDSMLDDVPDQLLHVAIEHRLMHAETLAYILHQLPYDAKIAPPDGIPEESDDLPPATRMVRIPAGRARLGLNPGEAFGWDNEFCAQTVEVPEFAIAQHKVTNGEYLEYVRHGAPAPFFWTNHGGRWFYRGMFAEMPLPLDWPVYVTCDEAAGYAASHGKSIATEQQYHRAAAVATPSGNVDFRHWDPISVTEGEEPRRPAQMAGNGWEWTSTIFSPFPGFEPFPFYKNYSEPFFDGQHYVLKGASPRTAACFLRPTFRNWFRPAYPYLYSTFRLMES